MKAEGAEINMYQFKKEEYEHRMEWYKRARFGMFIHWGLYAIPARGEWIRSYEKITKEDYMKYYHEFNPVDCDPAVWVKTAKMAGMKYIVLTAKQKRADKCARYTASARLLPDYLRSIKTPSVFLTL
jgi:hypothetical protein